MTTMAPKSRINVGNIWLAYEDTILVNHIKTAYFDDTYGSFTLTVGESKTRLDYTIRLNSVTELGRVVDITVTETNPTCTPWTCDPYKPGYEKDLCGNSRLNPLCGSPGGGGGGGGGTPGLYVDGKQGSVKVALDKPVTLKVQGIGANKNVRIDNISETPDAIVAQGTTNAEGAFETTAIFSTNASFQLRAYYNCVAFVCANETNTVNIQAGEGKTNWLMYAVIIGLLIIVFFYSKELGVFQAIRKR